MTKLNKNNIGAGCAASVCAALALAVFIPKPEANATTLEQWTFENSYASITGANTGAFNGTSPLVSEAGVLTGTASAYHAGSSTYSSPVGNGSSHSFSSTNWAVGDYYQFKLSTTGYQQITVTFDQISSGTGPRDFKLAYSTNGTSFTDITTYQLINNTSPNNWSSGAAKTTSSYTDDLTANPAFDNQSTLYFRLIDNSTNAVVSGSTVQTGGTDRVDNFIVTAAVPEPATCAMALGGLGVLMFLQRVRRK